MAPEAPPKQTLLSSESLVSYLFREKFQENGSTAAPGSCIPIITAFCTVVKATKPYRIFSFILC